MILSIARQKQILASKWKVVSIVGMSEKDRAYYQSLARNFYNKTNEELSEYIQEPEEGTQKNAWLDAEQHQTSTYLVIDQNVGEIVFYFSLCCGMLYSDTFMEYSRSEKEFLNIYRQALTTRDRKSIRELSALAPELDMEEGVRLMNTLFKAAKNDHRETKEDFSQVSAKTFPGIELTHFCKNDQYFSKPLGITMKTGAFVFWEFVVPEVRKCARNIAAKYLYLYAAESPVNRRLVPYYREHLQFEQMSLQRNLKTIKPYYDTGCISMLEEIACLGKNKKKYYDFLNQME